MERFIKDKFLLLFMTAQKKVLLFHRERGFGQVFTDFLSNTCELTCIPLGEETTPSEVAREVADKDPALVYLAMNFTPQVRPSGYRGPDKKGLEALVEIRKDSNVPIIMVTSGTEEHEKEARDKGANDYLVTPVNAHDLITLTYRYMRID